MIYKTKIKVRWSDLDANQHLANSQYLNFTSAARMEALEFCGLPLHRLYELHRGPVILEEKINYYKEVMPGRTLIIHTEIDGFSSNGVLFSFKQNIYSEEGLHHAHATLFGCWLNMQERKMAKDLPEEMLESLKKILSKNARELNFQDIKKLNPKPQNIHLEELL